MDQSRNNGPETGERRKPVPPVEHRFQPGNPGRPKGSRNKLGEDFIQALQESFNAKGAETIETVRAERPHEYLKVIAGILPKELKISAESDLTDDQLDQRIKQLAAALRLELRGEERTGEAAGGTEEAAGYH